MTEQIEDDFWAAARADDTAARGRQADPSACGTCRGNVEAGAQVEHDECAQRATLIPAPDAPGYELLTGLSEEELAALPPRFHVPAYMESSTPQMWVCAVCWGDGWVSQWPCKTAVKHGLRVFTPEHDAETAAKRQAARIAELEAEVDKHVAANLEAAERAQKEINRLRDELAEIRAGQDPRLRCLLVKAAPDRDLYIGWSTVAEMPDGIWSRETALDAGIPRTWLDRADETGTSALYPEGSWDDSGFVAEQRGWLPRARLGDYAVEYLHGDRIAAYAMLEPFEDEQEAGQ